MVLSQFGLVLTVASTRKPYARQMDEQLNIAATDFDDSFLWVVSCEFKSVSFLLMYYGYV